MNSSKQHNVQLINSSAEQYNQLTFKNEINFMNSTQTHNEKPIRIVPLDLAGAGM